MIQKTYLLLALVFAIFVPVNNAFANKAQIVENVLAEKGFYDASEIEKRIRFEALNTPIPQVEGDLFEEGGCLLNECLPQVYNNAITTDYVPTINRVDGLKIKNVHVPDLRIKFNAKGLSPNDFSHLNKFHLVLVKDDADNCIGIACHKYKIYSVEPEFKPNGDIKWKQFVSISNLEPGNYRVAVSLVYDNIPPSDWSNQVLFTVAPHTLVLADVPDSGLKSCLISAGYAMNSLVANIDRIECSNQDLVDADVSQISQYFSGVRYIDISNNSALTGIDGLGKLPHLQILDISENPNFLTTNLSNFGDLDALIMRDMGQNDLVMPAPPHNATYIDYSGNHFVSWQAIYDNRRDQAIQSLKLTNTNLNNSLFSTLFAVPSTDELYINSINVSDNAQLTDVSAMTQLEGLAHVNVNNTSLAGVQDFTGISGLCSLSMSNTSVNSIEPMMPVQYLNIQNNNKLKRALPLHGETYRPHWTNLSGSDNLKCHNHYNYIDNAKLNSGIPPLTDFSILDLSSFSRPLPSCDIQSTAVKYQPSNFCKPTKVKSIQVHEDMATSRRYLNWVPHSVDEYSLWGVTHYKISSLVNGQIISVRYRDINEGESIIESDMEPDSYIVQACTDELCGYQRSVSTPFEQGLTVISNLEQVWNADGDKFYFQFSYNQQVFEDSSNMGSPDFFEISPTFSQPEGVDKIDDVEVNGYQSSWKTAWINVDNYIGSHYKIKACRDDLGCGAPVTVTLNPPVVAQSIGQLQNVNVTGSQTTLTLSWDLHSEGRDLVDYIKVIETQPLLSVNHRATEGVPAVNPNEQVITYYSDNVNQNLKLKRITKGRYTFILAACHRDRENGDYCSSQPVTVNKTISRSEVNINLSDYLTGDELSVYASNVGNFFCDNQPPGSTGNIGCYTSPYINVFYGISFNARGNGWARPDYYYIEKNNAATSSGSYCFTKTKSETVGQRVDYVPLEDFVLRAKSTGRTPLSSYCGINNPFTSWRVAECFEGIGCGKQSTIRLPNGYVEGYEETNNLPSAPVILDTESGFEQTNDIDSGGPVNLPPGSYWDPEQSGTGWQFHWATQLPGVDQSGTEHGVTYDLIGYWFAYKRFGNNDTWSPVWFKSKLKLNNAGNAYDGSLLYTRKVGSQFIEEEAGNLVVHLSPNSNNRYNLLLDLDFNDSELTTMIGDNRVNTPCETIGSTDDSIGKCRFTLQDFNILIAGQTVPPNEIAGRFGYGNDADHYSGIWAYKEPGQFESEVTLITSIHRRMELTWVAFFDQNQGDPLWAIASTCDGDSCTNYPDDKFLANYKPTLADGKNIYTVPRGFNPLEKTPANFWNESTSVLIGRLGRCFKKNDDFDQGKFFLNVDTDNTTGFLSVLRHTNLQIGYEGAVANGMDCDNNNTSGMAHLDRTAGFSRIKFEVNDENNPHVSDPNYSGSPECDPGLADGLGYCDIRFDWYTDGFFPNIKPFYSSDNGQSFLSLLDSNLCNNDLPNVDDFLVRGFSCEISSQDSEVNYIFELRKLTYLPGLDSSDPNSWVTIAESRPLRVLPCNSDYCQEDDYTPLEEVTSSELPYIGPDTSASGNGNGMLELDDLPEAPVSSASVGATKGSFSVTPSGAATYNIPIFTVPASGGLQPELSLNYSSQGGRNSMGMGWSISGYSVISRCAQTFEQDYVENSSEPLVQSVTFTDSDRFCVDGQRLMLVDNSANYGSDGAEYRTEIDTQTRFFSRGTQGSGPKCFEALHKNGSKSYYGNCSNDNTEDTSPLVLSGLSHNSALMWAQSQFTDDLGNYYIYKYNVDITNVSTYHENILLEFNLDEVQYSANKDVAGSSLDGVITMEYQNVSSSQVASNTVYSQWVGNEFIDYGSPNTFIRIKEHNKKLVSISSKFDNSELRYYKLDYSHSDSAGFSLLTSIQECANSSVGSACYDPTVLNWGNTTPNNYGDTNPIPVLNIGYVNDDENGEYYVRPFDANGDGLTDFYVSKPSDKIYINTGNASFTSVNIPDVNGKKLSIADINADGYPDLIDHGYVYIWNGSGYEGGISIPDADLYVDIDGDGLIDAIKINTQNPNDSLDIFYNRYDLSFHSASTPAEAIENAFTYPTNVPIDYSGNTFQNDFTSISPYGQFLTSIDEKPPTIKEILSIYDADGDGVSEILVSMEKDDYCIDGEGDDQLCRWIPLTNLVASVELQLNKNAGGDTYKPNVIGGNIDCEGCKHFETIKRVDINGDGFSELCTTYIVAEETSYSCKGNGLTGIEFSGENLRLIDMVDLNGDGYLDMLYSDGHDINSKWMVKYTQWNNGNLSYASNWTQTNIKSGNAKNGSQNTSTLWKKDKSFFVDINNDGITDHLLFQVDGSSRELKVYKTMGYNLSGSVTNHNKLKSIKNGLGEGEGHEISINYDLMTNRDVYSRETNSINGWIGRSRSATFDYISTMPLVSSVSQSLPAWDLDSDDLSGTPINYSYWTSKHEYQYKNAKLQAGGRGFLGFGEISVFDNDTRILQQSILRHDFPYIGSVAESKTWHIPKESTINSFLQGTKDLTIPCWVSGNCAPVIPENNQCINGDELMNCTYEKYNTLLQELFDGRLLNHTINSWDTKDDNQTSGSYFPYMSKRHEINYSFQTDGLIKNSKLHSYDYDSAHNGFLTTTITTTYPGDLVGSNWLHKKTINQLPQVFDSEEWIVRNQYTEEIDERKNMPTKVRITERAFDANHLLYSEKYKNDIDGDGNIKVKTIVSRNAFKRINLVSESATSANVQKVKTIFDNRSRLKTESMQLMNGSFKTTEKVLKYSKLGLPEVTQNAQGVKTYMRYDDFGKLYYTISETGAFTKTIYISGKGSYCPSYTAYHTYQESRDGKHSISPDLWTCYDKLGREIRTVKQGFNTNQKIYVDKHYDTSGNLFAESIPNYSPPNINVSNQWERSAFDELGRLFLNRKPFAASDSNEVGENLTTTLYSYSNDQEKVEVTNALGHKTTSYYNALGELTEVRDAELNSVFYYYDARGNRTLVDGPLVGDEVYSYYDNFDHLKQINDPDLGLWYYKYNALGQLKYQVDAKGNCTRIIYDDAGRITDKYFYANSSEDCNNVVLEEDHAIFTYDNTSGSNSLGKLLSESNKNISKNYFYDDLGRLSSTTTELTNYNYIRSEQKYYDAYGRVKAFYDASGEGSLTLYNSQGYVYATQGIRTGVVYKETLAQDALGHVTKELAGNGIYTNRLYDVAGRLEVLTSGATEYGTEIQYMRYDYDAVGNMQQRIDDRFFDRQTIEDFQYDAVNRLTLSELTFTDDISTYYFVDYDISYDEGGRRKTLSELDGPIRTYTYNTGSIHGVDSTSDGQSYLYDNVGNQTLSAGRLLEYTAFNKVKRATYGSDVVEYLYGPNNEKILKLEYTLDNINLTWYIGGVEVFIEGWSNGITERVKSKRYIGSTLVTHLNADNIDIDYLHSDHLGSIQAITQQNHQPYAVQHLSYDAFGKRRNASSTQDKYYFFNPVKNVTDKGFTGQDHIDQLGLINFKARLYDPSLGMMLQADTVIPDGPVVDSINRYAYVYNNPLSYTDPSGHIPWDIFMSHWSSTYADWYQTQVKRLSVKTVSAVNQFNRLLTNGGNQAALPQGVTGGSFGNGDMASNSFSGLKLTSKEYKEAVKNGLWDNAYIDGGVKNNQSIDKERDRTNQAKSLAKEDLSVDKRYIEFIRDVAQITMDAANPRDPLTGNEVIGEKGMTLGLNEKGEVIVTGIIVGRNQGIEVGRIINENNANVIAHFHYEGLDFKHPSSGDHAATKLLNVSNLTVTPKKDRRSSRFSCCNIYEVGRNNGKEKYRNVTRGIGNWREHPEWD